MENLIFFIEIFISIIFLIYIIFVCLKTKNFRYLFNLIIFILIGILFYFYFEKIIYWFFNNIPEIFLSIVVLISLIILIIFVDNEIRQFKKNKKNKKFIEQKKNLYKKAIIKILIVIGATFITICLISFNLNN